MTEAIVQQIGTFGDFLTKKTDRINAIYGGAGSGKSHSVAQDLCLKFCEQDDIRILVIRKTLPALRITAYQLIKGLLNDWGVPYDLNRAELTITRGKNQILFKGLDDPEKIKSYEANYVWVEEATEISYEDFLQLNLRLRRPNSNGSNKIYLTFNPVDQYHWLIEKIIDGNRENVSVHHSTYKNNPFLSVEYTRELEGLISQDENYYRVYTLGLPGVLKNIIYTNYQVVKDWPEKFKDTFYGLDFGYNNPACLIEVNERDEGIYLRERLYETKLTNTDLLDRIRPLIKEKAAVYADSAEPDRIAEIRRASLIIFPAQKSIKDGIDHVKRYNLFIHPDSVNLIGEIRGYKWREDKDGHVIEDPVKFRDHAMDALRYAIHTHLGKQRSGVKISGVTRKW